MTNTQSRLKVFLGKTGKQVGTLSYTNQNGRQNSVFDYSQSWKEDPNSFSIAPSMPLKTGRFFANGQNQSLAFPLAICDSCPDAWGAKVVRKALRFDGLKRKVNDFDLLTLVDDFSRVGALRYMDEQGEFLTTSPLKGGLRAPPLIEMKRLAEAARALERSEENKSDIEILRRPGASLGGARPKASVYDTDKGRLLIAKFTGAGETKPTERVEVLTLNLASRVKLNASKASLYCLSDKEPIALIERFDRTANGNRRLYVSAQTFMDAPQAADNCTYTEIADQLRHNASEPEQQLHELFGRVAFTILVSNSDDHLKNMGFLLTSPNKWELSPMFDVNPDPDRAEDQIDLKTWISEESGPSASIEALIDAAEWFGLTREYAAEKVCSMAEVISSTWKLEAKAVGLNTSQIKDYHLAFENSETSYALNLGQPKVPGSDFNEGPKAHDNQEPDGPQPSF